MPFSGSILIVDDEPHVRRFLATLVRKLDLGQVNIHEACNGKKAIEMFASVVPAPGLVLLDINMPGIDGIETLRRLRAAGATCPIIMLTSLATRQMVENAIAAGADDYVRKDTPIEEIAARVNGVLGIVAARVRPADAP